MILSSTEARIKQKIEEAGKPLKDWDVNIYRGILTGFNEAFIIDGKTRNDLICKSPESAEIIHPILRGKDVKKYSVSFADLWLINTHNGLRQTNTQRINVEHDYPVIFNHLKKYEKQLASREDQGDTWSNLRNCAYLLDFNKPKIIYPEITKYLPFVYDETGYYLNNKTFFIVGDNLKYLVAFLNSKIFKSVLKINFPDLGEDRRELRKVFFEQIKIINPNMKAKDEIEKIVDVLRLQKEYGYNTTQLEQEIDQLLYQEYNLTVDEIALIDTWATI